MNGAGSSPDPWMRQDCSLGPGRDESVAALLCERGRNPLEDGGYGGQAVTQKPHVEAVGAGLALLHWRG